MPKTPPSNNLFTPSPKKRKTSPSLLLQQPNTPTSVPPEDSSDQPYESEPEKISSPLFNPCSQSPAQYTSDVQSPQYTTPLTPFSSTNQLDDQTEQDCRQYLEEHTVNRSPTWAEENGNGNDNDNDNDDHDPDSPIVKESPHPDRKNATLEKRDFQLSTLKETSVYRNTLQCVEKSKNSDGDEWFMPLEPRKEEAPLYTQQHTALKKPFQPPLMLHRNWCDTNPTTKSFQIIYEKYDNAKELLFFREDHGLRAKNPNAKSYGYGSTRAVYNYAKQSNPCLHEHFIQDSTRKGREGVSKLFIDVDLKYNPSSFFDVKDKSRRVVNALITSLDSFFMIEKIENVNFLQEYRLVLESHRNGKFSLHVIFPFICYKTMAQQKKHIEEYIAYLKIIKRNRGLDEGELDCLFKDSESIQDLESEPVCIIDLNVYSASKCLRMYLCTKGDDEEKKPFAIDEENSSFHYQEEPNDFEVFVKSLIQHQICTEDLQVKMIKVSSSVNERDKIEPTPKLISSLRRFWSTIPDEIDVRLSGDWINIDVSTNECLFLKGEVRRHTFSANIISICRSGKMKIYCRMCDSVREGTSPDEIDDKDRCFYDDTIKSLKKSRDFVDFVKEFFPSTYWKNSLRPKYDRDLLPLANKFLQDKLFDVEKFPDLYYYQEICKQAVCCLLPSSSVYIFEYDKDLGSTWKCKSFNEFMFFYNKVEIEHPSPSSSPQLTSNVLVLPPLTEDSVSKAPTVSQAKPKGKGGRASKKSVPSTPSNPDVVKTQKMIKSTLGKFIFKTCRKVSKVVFTNPDPCQLAIFNGFEGKPDDDFNYSHSTILPMLKHIRDILMGGDRESFVYFMKFLHYKLANPGKKINKLFIFYSEIGGTGKSIFLEWLLQKVFGTQWTKTETGLDRVTEKFNAASEYSVITYLEEPSGDANTEKRMDQMKALITKKIELIERKGHERYAVVASADYIASSNRLFIKSDRRIIGFESSPEKIGNQIYFKTLFDVINNPDSGKHFYHYVHKYDIDGWDIEKTPMSPFMKKLERLSLNPIVKFLFDLAEELENVLEDRQKDMEKNLLDQKEPDESNRTHKDKRNDTRQDDEEKSRETGNQHSYDEILKRRKRDADKYILYFTTIELKNKFTKWKVADSNTKKHTKEEFLVGLQTVLPASYFDINGDFAYQTDIDGTNTKKRALKCTLSEFKEHFKKYIK
jgi:hypothetical protein